jgi:phosphatidylglycerol:prolipoprotein diacylglycerol transferase
MAQLGPFQLGWHGIFTALAVGVGIWVGVRGAQRRGLPSEQVSAIVMWAIAGGVVGARLFHVLDHLPFYIGHPLQAFAVWEGGIAVYGAFLGGIAAGLFAARRAGLPAWRLLDAAAPAMLIGQAIGRLGCLSNGDAWGAVCTHPVGLCLVYTNPNDLLPLELHGVPTYPYPVYEIGAELVLLLGLWLARGRLRQPGARFLVAALGYAVIRVGLSFMRQEAIVAWGLQEAQLIALAAGLVALGLLLTRTRTHRAVPSQVR